MPSCFVQHLLSFISLNCHFSSGSLANYVGDFHRCHSQMLLRRHLRKAFVNMSFPSSSAAGNNNRGSDASKGVDKNPPSIKLTSRNNRRRLGQSNLWISEVGAGTIAWGDPKKGYGSSFNDQELANAFATLVQGDVNFFDTAEVYGYQTSFNGTCAEQLLGHLADQIPDDFYNSQYDKASPQDHLVIASKFFPVPWTDILLFKMFNVRMGSASILKTLKIQLRRLQLDTLPLYQWHFPFPLYPGGLDSFAVAMEKAKSQGLVQNVGLSNYTDVTQLHDAVQTLKNRGVDVVSNQVKMSMLDMNMDLVKACEDLGITVIAHTPLENGILTRAMLDEDMEIKSGASLKTMKYSEEQMNKYKPLLNLMKLIGAFSGGKSISQVALNYLICKGVVPIPGVKNRLHALDVVGAQGWRLDEDSIATLDEKLLYVKQNN